MLAQLPIAIATPARAAEALVDLAAEKNSSGYDVHLLNAYSIALSDRREDYRALLREASLNFADGKPLSWVSRLGGGRIYQVRGPQLFHDVMAAGSDRAIRHYFLGTTPATLAKLRQAVLELHPSLIIAGSESPPFRAISAAEQREQDERIRASEADIVWVGLGTPKQDFEAQRLAHSLPVVAIAVGAAFDFTAGTQKEAPGWLSRIGLEWLFRFASEPRRLWRRYLFGNFRFLWAVLTRRSSR